ncbi:MAG TPA: hypothetical protein VG675_12765 [Bryobacteraceae bacterium]|nr:hypothetical protein [Bryobacteraceae bacterium]
MKRCLLLLTALTVATGMASATTLCTSLVTLQDYITTGTCQSGSNLFVFASDSWTPNGPSVNNGTTFSITPSDVDVTVIDNADGFGLRFASVLFNVVNTQLKAGGLNYTLTYSLNGSAPYITGASAAVNGLSANGSSSITINKNEMDAEDESNFVQLGLNANSTSANSAFLPSVQNINISESIQLTSPAGTQNNAISFTSFDNSWNVPEPFSLVLMGSGLALIGLARLRPRSRR